MSGQTITESQDGLSLGATPAVQERVKFLGVIVSAAAAGLAIVTAQAFQFGEAAPGGAARAVVLAAPARRRPALVQGLRGLFTAGGSSR